MEDKMLVIHMTAEELADYISRCIRQQVKEAVEDAIYNKERNARRDKLISFNALVREKSVGARVRIKRLIADGHIHQTEDGKIIYASVLKYLENEKGKSSTK